VEKLRILLIEDNEDDANLIRHSLENKIKGILIKHIDSFELFKELIRNSNYDLILTDYYCGGFTGLDIVTELRSMDIKIPVILITGEHAMGTALAAIKMHVDDYVVKDYKYIKRLPSIINRVLNKSPIEEIKRNSEITFSDSLENYIDLFDNASEIIQDIWLDGSFINVNTAWHETVGYTNNDVNKLNIDDIIDEEWRFDFKEIMDQVRSGKQRQYVELGFISKSGKKILVEGEVTARIENRKSIGCHWTLHNVTDIKNTDKSFCDVNDQYMSVFEYAPNPLVMGDHRGNILQINRAACDIVGYTYEEMIGMQTRKITHPTDLSKSLKYHKKLLSGELENYTITIRYRHKKGHYIKVEVTAALIRNEKGQPRFTIAEFKEIKDKNYEPSNAA